MATRRVHRGVAVVTAAAALLAGIGALIAGWGGVERTSAHGEYVHENEENRP